MINVEEKRKLIKVAKMYFFEEMTQAEIARKIGVSRPVISKMLRKAKDEGIVEIRIHDDQDNLMKLEQTLAQHYHLQDVVIASTENMGPTIARKALGKVAADYVNRLMQGVKKVGVSWGKTLLEMVRQYPIELREDIRIIPLVGGMGTQHVELHANQIAYERSKKMNGLCEFLYAPAIVATYQQRENLIQLSNIRSVLQQGELVDLAIVGIGNPFQHSTMYDIGYLREEDRRELEEAQVVGDIGSQYILANGEVADTPINKKVIGIGLDRLKQIPLVVGVAAGPYKIKSMVAALQGGYIDILITDDQTAQGLLKQ